MPMGMAPPPGGPPPMGGGPPPQGGVNQMVAGDMAGRMAPPGGDAAGQLQQLLQQAVMVTVQAGPEGVAMQGLGEIWKGAFATLAQKIGPQGGRAPQGAGMPGAGMAPPPGGGMPPAGPQMSGPMGR